MKKIILSSVSIILVVVTLLTMFPISVFAASNDAVSMYYPKYTGKSGSIVSALKSLGINSSYEYRAKIAKVNSIGNPYKGTASQNLEMLSRLRKGTLIRVEYQAPVDNGSKYYPKYTGKSGSIVSALKSLGINSSYEYRAKIAKVNSIGNPYKGTASQNLEMLSRLRKGTLICAEYVETSSSNTNNSAHTHNMKKVSNTDNVIITYCACGYFECKNKGTVGVSAGALPIPLPNGGNLVDLGSLSQAVDSLGATITAGGAAAVGLLSNPYVIAAVVGGVLVYIIINQKGKTLEISKVERVSVATRLEELNEHKFYCAGLVENNGFKAVLIIKNIEMDMDQAIKYTKSIAQFNLPLEREVGGQKVSLKSLYTYHWYEAEEMCRRLATDFRYKFGSDTGPDCNIGFDKKYKADNINLYYEHYHIYYLNKKVSHLHIFFGKPYSIPKPYAA